MGLFRFRHFEVDDFGCGQKICSDSVLFGAWFTGAYPNAKSVLDIGTGSGVLALIAASFLANARILGVEIEPVAYKAAVLNFNNSVYKNRMTAVEGDFNTLTGCEPFDLIVCNPPFFTNGVKADNSVRATARHEGSLNIVSLFRFAKENLSADGHLGVISPADREQQIIFEGEIAGFSIKRMVRVRTTPGKAFTRILWDFCSQPCHQEVKELNLRDSANNYSSDYLQLVEDLYLTLK